MNHKLIWLFVKARLPLANSVDVFCIQVAEFWLLNFFLLLFVDVNALLNLGPKSTQHFDATNLCANCFKPKQPAQCEESAPTNPLNSRRIVASLLSKRPLKIDLFLIISDVPQNHKYT